jgi:uncharacterized protein YcgI (DUF1989 family)
LRADECEGQRGHASVSDLLSDKTPIRARHIQPGQAQAVEIKAGQFLQILTVQGKQVADFVAFRQTDADEFLSTAATRSTNANIVPQLGMTLYSNRRQPLFEIVQDTVGRHDMLYACCDPIRYELLGAEPGHASCRMALTDALVDYGIGYDRIPDPINWFMNVSIQQRGELEIREPLAEPGDYVLLRAIEDVIAAVSACPQDMGATNAGNPTDLTIRVYRDAPLPASANLVGVAPVVAADDGASAEGTPLTDAEFASVKSATIEAAASPGAAAAPQAAAVSSGSPSAFGRPAKLSDTAEATVIRVEPSASER